MDQKNYVDESEMPLNRVPLNRVVTVLPNSAILLCVFCLWYQEIGNIVSRKNPQRPQVVFSLHELSFNPLFSARGQRANKDKWAKMVINERITQSFQ